MKRFNEWVKIREDTGSKIGQDVAGDRGYSDGESGQLKATWELSDLSWSRYPVETKTHFNNLASKDPDVRTLMDKVEEEGHASLKRATQRSADYNKSMNSGDQEEVAPPEADSNSGAEAME